MHSSSIRTNSLTDGVFQNFVRQFSPGSRWLNSLDHWPRYATLKPACCGYCMTSKAMLQRWQGSPENPKEGREEQQNSTSSCVTRRANIASAIAELKVSPAVKAWRSPAKLSGVARCVEEPCLSELDIGCKVGGFQRAKGGTEFFPAAFECSESHLAICLFGKRPD